MPTIDTKSKVSLSTFKPKAHGQDAYKDKPLTLGVIVGVAFDKSVRQNTEKPDQPFIGLKGNFRCMLGNSVEAAMTGGVGTQAGICYLPEAWLDPMIKMLDDGAQSIEFAHKVSIEKAENAAGYSWILTPLTEPAANDPLSNILSKLPAVAAIEDKTADAETSPAASGKGKAA